MTPTVGVTSGMVTPTVGVTVTPTRTAPSTLVSSVAPSPLVAQILRRVTVTSTVTVGHVVGVLTLGWSRNGSKNLWGLPPSFGTWKCRYTN